MMAFRLVATLFGHAAPCRAKVDTSPRRVSARLITGLLVIAVLPATRLFCQETDQESTDAFQNILRATGAHFEFRYADGQLESVVPDESDGQLLSREIASAAGHSSGSSSSSGGSTWKRHMRVRNYSVSFGHGVRTHGWVSTSREMPLRSFLSVDELVPPFRKSVVDAFDQDAADAGLAAWKFGGLQGDLVALRTSPEDQSASLIVVPRNPEQPPVIRTGESFEQLWQQFPSDIDALLATGERAFGVRLPPASTDKEVLDAVHAQIATSQEKWEQFFELVQGLDTAEFDERQRTLRQISDNYQQWAAQIMQGAQHPDLSVQARATLNKIIKENTAGDQNELNSIIAHLKLADSPAILLKLLQISSEQDRQLIWDRLRKVTGQDFGDDLAAWNDYIDHLPSQDFSSSWNADFDRTELKKISKHWGVLNSIALVDDRLQIERDAWKRFYGGKTIQELMDEVKQELKKRQLPQSWLTNDQYSHRNSKINYEFALFDRLVSDFCDENNITQGPMHRINSQTQGNRSWTGPGRQLDLAMTPGQNNQPSDDHSFFKFHYQQIKGNQAEIWLLSHSEEGFRVTCFDPDSGYLLDVFQAPSLACRVVLLQGATLKHAWAADLKTLRQENGPWLASEVGPRLQELGIGLNLFEPDSTANQ